MPRQIEYTEEIGARICEELVEGHSLRSICKRDDFPAISSVFKWLTLFPAFAEQYARAREEQAETLADEIVAIADEADTVVKDLGDGLTAVTFDSVAVARNRLRVDARKWVASKLKPKVYGDKQTHEHSGPNGGPIPTTIQIVGVDPE